MTEKARKSLKPAGSRARVMYGFCKVHKESVANCPPFWPILLALKSPTYKFGKFLNPILKPFIINVFTVKDYFYFAEEVVYQQPDFYMGSLDVDSLLTNKPFEETTEICTSEFFKESETAKVLSKSKFKEAFVSGY